MTGLSGLSGIVDTSPTSFVSGMLGHWDASDLSTLDVSVDDALVGTWQDKSGNGNDWTQPTSGNKPTLKLAIQNGRPIIRFGGTDKFMDAGDIPSLATNDFTLHFVMFHPGTGSGTILSLQEWFDSPNRSGHFTRHSNADLTIQVAITGSTSADLTATNAFPVGSWHTITIVKSGTNIAIRKDGIEINSKGTWPATINFSGVSEETEIGRRLGSSPTNYITADIGEHLIYGTGLGANDIDQNESLLKMKWATP